MKKLNLLKSVLVLGFVLLMIQTFGQQIGISDARSFSGGSYMPPQGQYDPGSNRTNCIYLLDDGTQENSIGITGDADIMWLNYFTAIAGCELINTVYLTWGETQNGFPCRIILYEDPDDDGYADNAIYLTETATTVQNANTNFFTTVSITPTLVSGGFFVAAICQNLPEGNYAAPLDETLSQGNSWIAAHYPGLFDVYNLMSNPLPPTLVDYFFPGNWLLRAEGTEAGPVATPVSNWALFIGIGLILIFAVVRFRRLI